MRFPNHMLVHLSNFSNNSRTYTHLTSHQHSMITKFKSKPSTNCYPNPSMIENFRTQQSSNDYISRLCKQRLFREAIEAFGWFINKTNFHLSLSTYAYLIQACSNLKSLEQGRKIHAHLLSSDSQPDIVLQNHILNMYGKCRCLTDARKVFDKMPERNLVSWTAMIAGYSQNGFEESAVELYSRMRNSGFMPDKFTFGSIIRACSGLSDIELGKQLHNHVIRTDFGSDCLVQNALVAMYAKCDRIGDALIVFDKIKQKDLISWSSMIAGFAQQGCELDAVCLFKEMLLAGLIANEFVFGSLFRACSGLVLLEQGKQIHGMSIKCGFSADAFVGCSLSDLYAKCGSLDSATNVFNQIDNPDIVSWNAVIAGCAHGNDFNGAMYFFSQMRNSGINPDQVTVLCLLSACKNDATLCQGQQFHSYVFKLGFDREVSVSNALLTMYANTSNLSNAFIVFADIGCQDLVSWNAIITASSQHGRFIEVFQLLKLMHNSENRPDQITLFSVLGACASIAALEQGIQVHDYAMKTGLAIDLSVANGLIDMYMKCGSPEDARKLFSSLSNADCVSWSSLIVGYAQFGCGREALKLFGDMQALGVKPNHVTFVGVLSACSHIGLVDEGCHYYKSMETDYGIVPTREHCACMVDLLGRAGYLREAVKFIQQMPFDPDIIVWKTLLAACRNHGNAELGKLAAENVLELNPSNTAAYVLLSNIYASSGCWDEVARLRRLMRAMGARKDPGQSWIKIKDTVHVFVVEDRTHLNTNEIYELLGQLTLQMRKAGYKPNQPYLNDVLHGS